MLKQILKSLFRVIIGVLASITILSLVSVYMQNPKRVHVKLSGNQTIDKLLTQINNDCEDCLFKPGIYNATINFDELGANYLGLASMNPIYCTIKIDSSVQINFLEKQIKYLLLHEIAHCMGYNHDSNDLGIMSPYLNTEMSDEEYYKFVYRLSLRIKGVLYE